MDEERRSLVGDGIFAAIGQIQVLIEMLEGEEAERMEAALEPLLTEVKRLPDWEHESHPSGR